MQSFSFDPDQQSSDGNIILYLKFLLRYWWIIGPLTFIGGALAFFISTALPPKYRAQCRLEIFENKAAQIGKDISGARAQRFDNPIDRHIVTLKGTDINRKVRAEILEKYSDLKKVRFNPIDIQISPVKGANKKMLDIRVDSFDKAAALEYLNKLMENYDRVLLDEYRRELSSTRKILQNEEKNLNGQTSALQEKITKFKTDNNYLILETKSAFDKEYIAEMLQKAHQMQMEIEILQYQLKLFDGDINKTKQLPQLIDAFSSLQKTNGNGANSSNSSLELDIQEWKKRQIDHLRLSARYQNLSRKYKDAHPKIRETIDELETVKSEQKIFEDNILYTFRGRLETLKREQSSYLKRADKIEARFGDNASLIAQYEEMQQNLRNLQKLKNSVHSRKLTYASAANEKFFKRFISKPSLNGGIAWPNKNLFTLAGLAISFALTAGIILLICISRTRFYDFSILSHENGITSLGVIPHFNSSQGKRNPFFLDKLAKSDPLIESYRAVRLNIDQRLDDKKTLLVCSASPGEGKTTTALHLALCYSWTNRKVLLIDADFRRQNLGKYIKLPTGEGTLEHLKDSSKNIKQSIQKDIHQGIDYLAAGRHDDLVTELLESDQIEVMLSQLRDDYDIIIIDSAPVNNIVDTVHLSKSVDAALIVARMGATLPHDISVACNRLADDKVIGYMLNDFKSSHSDYLQSTITSYGYHSSYRYE